MESEAEGGLQEGEGHCSADENKRKDGNRQKSTLALGGFCKKIEDGPETGKRRPRIG